MTARISHPQPERSSLAQLLRDSTGRIIRAFIRQAARIPREPQRDQPCLQNALPETLEYIACLAESPDKAPALTEAWRRQVSLRLQEGGDPRALIQEYQLLLDCILYSRGEEPEARPGAHPQRSEDGGVDLDESWDERLVERLSPDEIRLVRRLFDEAILEAVSLSLAQAQKRDSEQEARLSRQAQNAVRAREELMATVSHDLRNPLSAIMMSAGLLLRASRLDNDPKRAQKHAELILNAAERMDHLLRDLVDFASIEAGALRIERRVQDASALLDAAFQLLEPLAAQRQIRCRKEIAAEGLFVFGDSQRVLQVFSKLIGNAVKFTPPGGTITLRAMPRHREVLFSVSDTGPGISPAVPPHLFERYTRGRENRKGVGLGLYLARGIVEAHGGRLWVKSLPGAGSTFFFTLPARA